MITSYFNNLSVGMTKDTYFEMCETLGSEPLDEEIPIEVDDLPVEVQEAISVYYKLKDEWDTMGGNYLGKSYSGFSDILNILEVPHEDRRNLLEWIGLMDSIRSKAIQAAKPKKQEKQVAS